MENLILISNNSTISVSLLLLSLVFFIFIIKKFITKPGRTIKYLYFIYFITIFKVFTKNSPYFNTNKTLGIFYIILSFSVIKFIDILFNESYYKKKKNLEIPHLIRNIFVFTTFIISFLFILKTYFNVNLTSLLTTSAILSAVIGLAVQDTLTTFIAGLVLTSDKFLQLGDTIIFNDITGKIIDTNWRSTKIQKAGGGVICIPNNMLLKEISTNYFKNSELVIAIKVSAHYSDPPNKVKEILMNIASHNENILKNPEPMIVISAYGDYGIHYELRAWIKDEYLRRAKTETELYSAIWYSFKRNGIKIPYPTREILTSKDIMDTPCSISSSYFQKVEFLKALNPDELGKLCHLSDLLIYGKDEYIFFQEDEGDSFFIIKSGTVSVILDGRAITQLGEGSFFGEMSLLTGKPRTASIRAIEDTEVLVINKDSFKMLIQNNSVLLNSVLEYLTIREEEQINIKEKANLNSLEKTRQKENIKETTLQKLIKFFEI